MSTTKTQDLGTNPKEWYRCNKSTHCVHQKVRSGERTNQRRDIWSLIGWLAKFDWCGLLMKHIMLLNTTYIELKKLKIHTEHSARQILDFFRSYITLHKICHLIWKLERPTRRRSRTQHAWQYPHTTVIPSIPQRTMFQGKMMKDSDLIWKPNEFYTEKIQYLCPTLLCLNIEWARLHLKKVTSNYRTNYIAKKTMFQGKTLYNSLTILKPIKFYIVFSCNSDRLSLVFE